MYSGESIGRFSSARRLLVLLLRWSCLSLGLLCLALLKAHAGEIAQTNLGPWSLRLPASAVAYIDGQAVNRSKLLQLQLSPTSLLTIKWHGGICVSTNSSTLTDNRLELGASQLKITAKVISWNKATSCLQAQCSDVFGHAFYLQANKVTVNTAKHQIMVSEP